MTLTNQARVVAWGLALVVIVLSLVPPELRLETIAPHFLEHFSMYVILGAAFAIGYNKKQGLLAIFFVIFAGALEATQLLVPGRHARLSDFVIDALGMYVGLFAVALTVRICAIRVSLSRGGSIADGAE
jgi:VanZ family protein